MRSIFMLSVIVLSQMGCSDPLSENVLEEEPFSIQTPDKFYNSPSEGYAGLNSIWGTWPSNFPSDRVFLIDGTTDNHGGPGWARLFSTAITDVNTHRYDASNALIENEYQRSYQMIFRANSFIEAMEAKTWDQQDEPVRIAQIAEAKLYRAYAYFDLVRMFGGVPVLIETEQSGNATEVPQATVQEVYDQIISDLRAAQTELPARSEQPTGRAFKEVATGILAKVYLTMGGLPLEQQDKFELAVQEAEKVIDNEADYPLFDDYTTAFSQEAQNAGEQMLAIQTFGPGAGFWYPSNTRLPFNPYHIEFVDSFEEGDERKGLTFWPFYSTQQLPVDPDTVTVNEEDDVLYCGKYRTDPAFVTDAPNWPILRYAEVLLIHAEAVNEASGPTAAAYESLNKVRNRAGLDDLPGLSQESFREAVKHERRVELSMEMKRWFDLVRWGQLIEKVNAKYERKGENPPLEEKHRFFPIPQVEIDRNPSLSQNEGW